MSFHTASIANNRLSPPVYTFSSLLALAANIAVCLHQICALFKQSLFNVIPSRAEAALLFSLTARLQLFLPTENESSVFLFFVFMFVLFFSAVLLHHDLIMWVLTQITHPHLSPLLSLPICSLFPSPSFPSPTIQPTVLMLWNPVTFFLRCLNLKSTFTPSITCLGFFIYPLACL